MISSHHYLEFTMVSRTVDSYCVLIYNLMNLAVISFWVSALPSHALRYKDSKTQKVGKLCVMQITPYIFCIIPGKMPGGVLLMVSHNLYIHRQVWKTCDNLHALYVMTAAEIGCAMDTSATRIIFNLLISLQYGEHDVTGLVRVFLWMLCNYFFFFWYECCIL